VSEIEKHVLDQAKIEIEHTRSWPTKILAFYVAIIAGVLTTVISLSSRTPPVVLSGGAKLLLAFAILCMAVWVLFLLGKNHRSYLRHRNLQVQFQVAHAAELKEHFETPPEWLVPYKVSLTTRWSGWGFFAFLVCLVAALGVTSVWKS